MKYVNWLINSMIIFIFFPMFYFIAFHEVHQGDRSVDDRNVFYLIIYMVFLVSGVIWLQSRIAKSDIYKKFCNLYLYVDDSGTINPVTVGIISVSLGIWIILMIRVTKLFIWGF